MATLVLVLVGNLMSREGSAMRPDPIGTASVAAHPVTANVEMLPLPANPWVTVTVQSGDTLSSIFDAQGLPIMDWVQIIKLGGDAHRLKMLKAGEKLQLRKSTGGLQELTYALDEARTLQISRTGETFETITLAAEIERRPTYATGVINTSPWEAGIEAGLPESLIIEMADLFGYDIDFGQDLRVGDRFTVIYDELYKNGEKLRAGDILAAEFVNQGTTVRTVRYTDPQGHAGYYTPDGQSLRKAFIRTPLDVFRISSNFSTGRRHPVLNRIRAHLGTDYAAPTGTPVKATGDGRITFIGSKGGYGRAIVIKHGASYETLYGHLSRFRSGLSQGSRVQQGQVIGYVGSTGLATGPHLHYEFRVNGVHRDPRKVALPRATPLPRQHLAHFRATSEPLLAQLNVIHRTRIAQAP
ncbi:MAG: peptidoglycan DD-metalloendopeptidase family protein [Nevskiales bacterium]|nr:peptidoglycan DD-metalloendopeptidase family protein [Nevskiales bacterium]